MGCIGLSIAELQHALKIILAHTWGQLCFFCDSVKQLPKLGIIIFDSNG